MLPTHRYGPMTNVAVQLVGRVGVAVNNATSPSADDWDAYLAMAGEGMKLAGGLARFKQLVVTDGGGPNAAQRKATMDLASRYGDPSTMKIAAVSNNIGVRGMVTAFNWVGAPIRAFSPTQLGEAFAYLGISDDDALAVCRVVTELSDKIVGGVASAQSAPDMVRSLSKRGGR